MTDNDNILQVIDDLKKQFNIKQKEYKGASDDVFRNFNQGAKLNGESPEATLLGYVNKQIVSLFDAKNINPDRLNDVDFINEKAGDIATYMIILMGMVRSKQGKPKHECCKKQFVSVGEVRDKGFTIGGYAIKGDRENDCC